MTFNLQQDPAGGGAPAPPAPPATPVATPPAAPVTPSTAPQQPPAPDNAAIPPVAQVPPAAEPPIPADTPMIYANRSGQDQQNTVAELIDAKLKLDELGDIDRLTSLKAAMDGDPAAIQGLLQGYLKDSQAASPATPQPGAQIAAQIDPETSQRLERLEQDAVYSRRFADEAQQSQTMQWIQSTLASEGISKHIPLTAAHPDAPRRIMENMNTAKALLSAQGIKPETPQGQRAMQQVLFNSFNSVERQLAADQAHFAGGTPATGAAQVQAIQVPGQPAPQNGSVVPQPSGGAAPLMAPGQSEGPPSKQNMRDQLRAQSTQMGMT